MAMAARRRLASLLFSPPINNERSILAALPGDASSFDVKKNVLVIVSSDNSLCSGINSTSVKFNSGPEKETKHLILGEKFKAQLNYTWASILANDIMKNMEYERTRQASITSKLIENISGASALTDLHKLYMSHINNFSTSSKNNKTPRPELGTYILNVNGSLRDPLDFKENQHLKQLPESVLKKMRATGQLLKEAAIGIILRNPQGKVIFTYRRVIKSTTSEEAETLTSEKVENLISVKAESLTSEKVENLISLKAEDLTSELAERLAYMVGLEIVSKLKYVIDSDEDFTNVRICTDSKNLFELIDNYNFENEPEDFQDFVEAAINEFSNLECKKIPRLYNGAADRLANAAYQDMTEDGVFLWGEEEQVHGLKAILTKDEKHAKYY